MFKTITIAATVLMIAAGAATAQTIVNTDVTNFGDNADMDVDVTVTITPKQAPQPQPVLFGRYCRTQVTVDLLPYPLPLGSGCTPRNGNLFYVDVFGNVITGFVE